jgi:predicted ABC-type sugar transport system permease subunit
MTGTATTEQRGGGALRERLSGVRGVMIMADVGRPVPLAILYGTLVGPFVIALIRNGAVLLDVHTFYQVVISVIIWLVVFWDQYERRRLAAASA